MEKAFVPTGIEQEAIEKYHADLDKYDPGNGKHMWTIMVMHQVTDPETFLNSEGVAHLDFETLMTIEGPGCFKCEQSYTPELAKRWCNGVLHYVGS
jgi:hypothetical protein